MLAHRYQVWGWGARASKGSDRCEKYPVGVITWAKRDLDSPYEVYNELVAMNLGRAMGMPIPPGVVVEREQVPFFASLRIGIEGSDLPDADVDGAIVKSCGWSISGGGFLGFDSVDELGSLNHVG